MLNRSTIVRELEDKGSHKHRFLVTCGVTGIPYEISAESNRERNEWMLEIKKVFVCLSICLSLSLSVCLSSKALYNTCRL